MEMAVTMKANPTIIIHSNEDNDNTRWGSNAQLSITKVANA
jgi:hypothetical protein